MFSAAAWGAPLPPYEQIRDMPFIRELGAGPLSLPRFQHSIIQDTHYLVAFGQALAVAAAKAQDPAQILHFAEAAQSAIAVERGSHTDFIRRFGLDAESVAATPLWPTCHHYTTFLPGKLEWMFWDSAYRLVAWPP